MAKSDVVDVLLLAGVGYFAYRVASNQGLVSEDAAQRFSNMWDRLVGSLKSLTGPGAADWSETQSPTTDTVSSTDMLGPYKNDATVAPGQERPTVNGPVITPNAALPAPPIEQSGSGWVDPGLLRPAPAATVQP